MEGKVDANILSFHADENIPNDQKHFSQQAIRQVKNQKKRNNNNAYNVENQQVKGCFGVAGEFRVHGRNIRVNRDMSRRKWCLNCAKMAFKSVKVALFKNIKSLWSLISPTESPFLSFLLFSLSLFTVFLLSLLYLPSLLVVFFVFWIVSRYAR